MNTATVGWIVDRMNEFAPEYTAMEYDNVGLQVGSKAKTVNKVLLALDMSEIVLKEALSIGAQMVITHHPYIHDPMTAITDATKKGEIILRMIENGIALYCAHTNLDKAVGGTNDILFDLLGLTDKEGLYATDQHGFSLGRVGNLQTGSKLKDFAIMIAKRVGINVVKYVGDGEALVKRVGLCSGGAAGAKYVKVAKDKGCDVYLTGDVRYHEAQDALDIGIHLVDYSHFGSEIIYADPLCKYLNEQAKTFDMDVIFIVSEVEADILKGLTP